MTGGIGSGKSLVCRILKRRGLPVISADRIANDVTRHSPTVRRKLITLLGPDAYTRQGHLNRPYVASLLFSRRRIQKGINAIIHPIVLKNIRRRIKDLERNGKRSVVVEAALLFEAGMEKMLDLVIVVDAEEKVRMRRISRRDGLTRNEVIRRMKSQWRAGRKTRRADIVIENNGTQQELRKRVLLVTKVIRVLSRSKI